MNNEKTIDIAIDFSKYPGGRFRGDGEFSGEHFRDDLLVPALQDATIVIVRLDGTLGYGSSFLEEAFGGLVRNCGFRADDLERRLKLESVNETMRFTIIRYIREAESAVHA